MALNIVYDNEIKMLLFGDVSLLDRTVPYIRSSFISEEQYATIRQS